MADEGAHQVTDHDTAPRLVGHALAGNSPLAVSSAARFGTSTE
jgi:hypothetical protein